MRIILIFILLISWLQAESVRSTTGNVVLDINNDGTSEAMLTSDGLAIGPGLSPSANLHLQGNGIITGEVVIGGTTGNSTLEVQGSFGFGVQTVSDDIVASGNSIVIADTSAGNLTVTLPYAGNVTGRKYMIKKSSASNKLWVAGGGNMIDELGSIEMTTSGNGFPYLNVVSDGSQWRIIAQSSGIGSLGSDNLIGWWKFDESSGTSATDSSGQGNNGTLTNMAGSEWTSGKVNGALNFDGSNDYVISTLDGTSLGETSATLWYQPNSTVATQRGIFQWADQLNDMGPFILMARENNSANVMFYVDGNYQLNYDIANGEWHHLAVTLNTENIWRFYVNGVLQGSYTDDATHALQTDADNIYLGNGFNGYSNGLIDDVRIYNKALSVSEVRALHGGEYTPWTPADMTTTLWLDASDASSVTVDGSGNVSQWNDKSGNAYHAAQATSDNRPAYITNGLNNENIMRFTYSGNHSLAIASTITMANTDQTTMFSVFKSNNVTETYAFVFHGSNGTTFGHGFQGNNDRRLYLGGTNHIGFSAAYDYSTVIWASRLEGGSTVDFWEYSTNLLSTTDASTLPATFSNAQVGQQLPSYNLDGDVCEIIIFETALSTVTRQKVEGYLAHKWGLEANLPAGHPYIDTAP